MRLQAEELDFAREHITQFYSSDFFPDVPEFAAIWAAWDEVRDHLMAQEIADLGRPPLMMAAPKSGGGFRVVHQLHPFDAITYTALARKIALDVEARRPPVSEGTVCSYRIALTPKGHFFSDTSDGYSTFERNSAALAEQKGHVLSLDVASFYNHIYLHRVQSSLETCSPKRRQLTTEIEEFLLNLNQRVSVGIPIGPAASIIFAEAVLVDVDEFIRTSAPRGVDYVRYVDDFRFFSNSRADLEQVQHELTSYLFSAHRLTLAAGKTQLRESAAFRSEVLEPPEEAEQRALQQRLADLSDDFESEGYGVVANDDDEEEADTGVTWESATTDLKRGAIEDLFDEVVAGPTLKLGLARHILRRSRRSRIRAILKQTVANIGLLSPAIRDVGLYLDKVLSPQAVAKALPQFEKASQSQAARVPLVRHWLRWLFASREEFAASQMLEDFVRKDPADARANALFAATNGRGSWVKQKKDSWRDLGPWDRSGLLMSGRVLSTKERNVWMDAVIRAPVDPLDAVVAKYVKSL